MRAFKTYFTREYLEAGGTETAGAKTRVSKQERAVWQPRFWEHTIDHAKDYERHFDYIHYNPVKHGLARDSVEWPWSSVHRSLRKRWYPEGWGRIEPDSIGEIQMAGE